MPDFLILIFVALVLTTSPVVLVVRGLVVTPQ